MSWYTKNNGKIKYFDTFKETLIYCESKKFQLTIVGKINEKEFSFSRKNIKFILK